jgi:hypothetical protein
MTRRIAICAAIVLCAFVVCIIAAGRPSPTRLNAMVVEYRSGGYEDPFPMLTLDRLQITQAHYDLMKSDRELATCERLVGKWYAISDKRGAWETKPAFLNSHQTKPKGGDWEIDDALLHHPAPECQASAQEVVSRYLGRK